MKTSSYVEYLVNDVFANIDGFSAKKMFGGYGLYKEGIMFGLIAGTDVYFKVDELNKPTYVQQGSKPFIYAKGNHKSVTMSYWLVPSDIIENTDTLHEWIKEAVQAAFRSKKKNLRT